MINKLSDYGYNFQVKSIVLYLNDNDFTAQILDVLDWDAYQSESLKWIVKQCKEYFEQYKKNIKFEVFKIKVQEIDSDILSTAIKQDLKEVYKNMEADDLDYIRDNILNFFKNQTLKKAILKSVDILELSLADLQKYSSMIDADIFDIIRPEMCIASREGDGGTSPKSVVKKANAILRRLRK